MSTDRPGLPALRRAAAGDAPAIVALREDLTRWLLDSGVDQWRSGDLDESVVAAQCADGQWHVADVAGRIAATVRLCWSDPEFWGPDDAPAGYVHGLMVDRTHSGLGWGGELIEWAARATADAGFHRVRLDTAAHNPTMVDYYRSHGFAVLREAPLPARFGRAMTVVLFERVVDPGQTRT